MFLTKTSCQMFFKLVLKCFKLKKLVVEQKTAQSVDPQLNRSRSESTPSSTGRGCKKLSLSSRMVVQPVKVEPQPVEVRSRPNGHMPNIKC